ncbi:MAG: hypothetical protein ABWW65_04800 [Thermoprotei archaeon]
MKLHLFKVLVDISGYRGILYTSKLVKSVLVESVPETLEVFKPSSSEPKLVHITPLFKRSKNGLRPVYSTIECSGGRCSDKPRPIRLSGTYAFYVGFPDTVLEPRILIDKLTGFEKEISFQKQRVRVKLVDLEHIDPYEYSESIVNEVLDKGKLKIVFTTPAMFKDPFRKTRYKSLLPSVFNIFATPLYVMLYSQGILSKKAFRKQLLILHRIFSEPYSVLKTTSIEWIVYDKKPEPALTGYVNLYINREYVNKYSKYIDIREYLVDLFAYMYALGIGSGRASGFGHVQLEPGKPTP